MSGSSSDVRIALMLAVDDAAAAADWYARALGARELWNLGGVVGLHVAGAPFLLHEPTDGFVSPSGVGHTTVRVEVFVDDPDAFVRRAAAAGADAAGRPVHDHEMPWGRHRQGGFRDPFGHVWHVGDTSPLPDVGYAITPIGRVESSLRDRAGAPKQGTGAPDAWLVIAPEYADGLRDLELGAEVLLLTWFDRADRTVLHTRPRDDPANPVTGVFSTRSADRPNPVGLHRVRVLDRDGARLRVGPLEALDGTPVVDLKPVLGPAER